MSDVLSPDQVRAQLGKPQAAPVVLSPEEVRQKIAAPPVMSPDEVRAAVAKPAEPRPFFANQPGDLGNVEPVPEDQRTRAFPPRAPVAPRQGASPMGNGIVTPDAAAAAQADAAAIKAKQEAAIMERRDPYTGQPMGTLERLATAPQRSHLEAWDERRRADEEQAAIAAIPRNMPVNPNEPSVGAPVMEPPNTIASGFKAGVRSVTGILSPLSEAMTINQENAAEREATREAEARRTGKPQSSTFAERLQGLGEIGFEAANLKPVFDVYGEKVVPAFERYGEAVGGPGGRNIASGIAEAAPFVAAPLLHGAIERGLPVPENARWRLAEPRVEAPRVAETRVAEPSLRQPITRPAPKPPVDIAPLTEPPKPTGETQAAEFAPPRVEPVKRIGRQIIERFTGEDAKAQAEAALQRRGLDPEQQSARVTEGESPREHMVVQDAEVTVPEAKPAEIGFRRIGKPQESPAPRAPYDPAEALREREAADRARTEADTKMRQESPRPAPYTEEPPPTLYRKEIVDGEETFVPVDRPPTAPPVKEHPLAAELRRDATQRRAEANEAGSSDANARQKTAVADAMDRIAAGEPVEKVASEVEQSMPALVDPTNPEWGTEGKWARSQLEANLGEIAANRGKPEPVPATPPETPPVASEPPKAPEAPPAPPVAPKGKARGPVKPPELSPEEARVFTIRAQAFERRMREAEEQRAKGEKPTPREGPTLGSVLGGIGPASPTKGAGMIDTGWRKTIGRGIDAVAERANRVPFVRRIRQAFVNEELTLDPSEELHQAKQRLGKGGGSEKWQARQSEKLSRSIDKELRQVPTPDVKEAYRYLGGDTNALPASVTPKAKAALDAASAAMHVRRVAMQARGIISDAVLKEYPRFVSRIMRLHAEGTRTLFGSGKVSKIVREAYRMDAPGVLFDHGEQAVTDLANRVGAKTKVITGTKNTTLVKFDTPAERDAFIEQARQEFGHRKGSTGWRDSFDALSDADRQALGEITDPADSFAITMARANAKIAAHDFLAELQNIGGAKAANGGDWVVDVPKGTKPPPGYIQVEGHQWGPLNGKALAPEIHEYATGILEPKSMNAVLEAAKAAYGTWKLDRTVRSWPTVVRNWMSHHYMSAEAGVNLLNPENWSFHKQALDALRGADDATLKWAVENGIVGNDWYATLNRERIGNALNGSESPVTTIFKWFTEHPDDIAQAKERNVAAGRAIGKVAVNPLEAVPGFEKATKAAGHLYSLQEDMIRLPAALKLRESGMGLPSILKELESTTTSYARHGAAQRMLGNVPTVIGPFARFMWERNRIAYNNLRNHPTRLAQTIFYSYVLKKALEAEFGDDVTNEEKKAVESEFGSQTAALNRDEKGRVKTLDLRWLVPMGPILAGPETEKYEGTSGAYVAYISRLLGGGMSPVVDPITAAFTGHDSRNRPVADVFTRDKWGALGTAGEIWRQYVAPPVIGRHLDALEAAKAGVGVTKNRPVLTEADVIAGYMTGLSTGRLDYDSAMDNLKSLLSATKREVKSSIKERVRKGATDEETDALAERGAQMVEKRAEGLGKRADILDAAEQSRKKP